MITSTYKPHSIDQHSLWQMLIIIFAAVLINSYIFVCDKTCALFTWGSWAIIWLPVFTSYFISYLFQTTKELKTQHRSLAIIVAFIINIILSSTYLEDPDGYIPMIYLFILLPSQLGLIFLFDLILKLIRSRCRCIEIGKSKIWNSLMIALISLGIVHSSLTIFKIYNNDIIASLGMYIWLPVVSSYAFAHFFRKFSKPVRDAQFETIERILLMLFCAFISMAYLSITNIARTASYMNIAYIFVGFIGQVIMILLIDLFRFRFFGYNQK